MGREVRRVPANWEHPKRDGYYIPLHDGFNERYNRWKLGKEKWEQGFREDIDGNWIPIDDKHKGMPFEEWEGSEPQKESYMPDWPIEERTHYQMYEHTSEGTPLSPVMATPEELAQWLVDNKASAFANHTAPYEDWLAVCKGRWAPSAAIINGEMIPGVSLQTNNQKE